MPAGINNSHGPAGRGSRMGLPSDGAVAPGPAPLHSQPMTPWTSGPAPKRMLAALALAALTLSGCKKADRADEFPLSVGFQPLEAVSPAATWPAATPESAHPQGLGPVVAASNFQHWGSHARGYLHAPLAKVYLALQDPAASYIHNDGGVTTRASPDTFGVEPFPVSFVVHYVTPNQPVVGDVRFDVTYRAGPLEGTVDAPVVIGQRYQKTFGTGYIEVMAGSLVATAVEGAPDVTSVEMVAWLKASTQGQADCDGTLVDLFGDLEAKLASMP